MVYDVRNTRSYLSKLVDPERNGSLLSVIPHGNSILCTDQYASYTWELDESQQYITQPLHFQNQVQDKDTKENIYSVSMTKNTFVTSKRIGRRMEHYVNNITNENGQRVFSEAWSCAVFQVIPSFCRNAHFTRDDDVFLCYAEEDKVLLQRCMLFIVYVSWNWFDVSCRWRYKPRMVKHRPSLLMRQWWIFGIRVIAWTSFLRRYPTKRFVYTHAMLKIPNKMAQKPEYFSLC